MEVSCFDANNTKSPDAKITTRTPESLHEINTVQSTDIDPSGSDSQGALEIEEETDAVDSRDQTSDHDSDQNGDYDSDHDSDQDGDHDSDHDSDEESDEESDDEDEDPLEIFQAVLKVLQVEEIPAHALKIRKRLAGSKDSILSAAVSSPPLTGGYHILFIIDFDDGIRWLLKVPQTGAKDNWNDVDATTLSTEALTMQLLSKKTTIPVPEVFDFEASLENPLRVPFILMEYIQGLPLSEVWFDNKISKDELTARRINVLEGIAKSMIQLSQFSFERGGSILFDTERKISGIGPYRVPDNHAMLARLGDEDNDNAEPIYVQYGPVASSKAFFQSALLRLPEPNVDWVRIVQALLRFFVGLIPGPDGDLKTKPFVLTHPDLDIQNVIVSQNGNVLAIIDWDGVSALPRLIGNERYPSWLTRDWDPAMYIWEEGMEAEPDWREDSPTSLEYYRTMYAGMMKSLKLQHDIEGADCTIQSLVVENLVIAIDDSICTSGILENLFLRVVAAVAEDERAPNLDYWKIGNNLVEGDLSKEHEEALKAGFEAVLAGYDGNVQKREE